MRPRVASKLSKSVDSSVQFFGIDRKNERYGGKIPQLLKFDKLPPIRESTDHLQDIIDKFKHQQ